MLVNLLKTSFFFAVFFIMQPPDLRYIVKSTILKYLVCSSDISRDHLVMLEYFEYFGQGVFGDEILSQIIEDFPSELTDELLLALSPPHLRHLKLTKCSRLSCSGLQRTIAKCQQLQALDFSECIHLLHPTMFCCLKDKAANLVSLSLENSLVVSDDIVQVALMCCPGLKHLNLSSCRNITDSAFALPNFGNSTSTTSSTKSALPTYTSQPGGNLTSVDISGCQSLSTVTVKYLVGLCGASLKSVNLAWTGVNCTALLYLAGLNIDEVARLVHQTNPQTGLKKQNCEACCEENFHYLETDPVCSEILQNITQDDNVVSQACFPSAGPVRGVSAIGSHDCDENQLIEIDISTLKDVLPVICTSQPLLLQPAETEHLPEFNGSSDEESDDSFKTASNEIDITNMPCFLAEEEAGFPASEQNDSRHEESLDTQERCGNDMHGDTGKMKSAETRKFCWNTFSGSKIKETPCEEVCACDDFAQFSCAKAQASRVLEPQKMVESEHYVEGNSAMISICCEQSIGEDATEETFEECFDTESHLVMPCKEEGNMTGGQFVHHSAFKTLDNDCDDAIMVSMAINGKKSDYPTIPCEVKCDKWDCLIMPCTTDSASLKSDDMYHEELDCPAVPCEEVMDPEVQYNNPRLHCTVEGGEADCPVALAFKETDEKGGYSVMPCTVHENQKPSTSYVGDIKSNGFNHAARPCWGDAVTLPDVPCEGRNNRQSRHSEMCSDAEDRTNSDGSPSYSRAIQVGDLLQAQTYQPQITNLDISNICYQNKPLGATCLKVFFKACKCLKNVAVSWTELDDEVLTYLLKNEAELRYLSLADCENLSNLSVSMIPVHCRKLISFDLKGMCYVTDHGVMPLTRSNDLESLCLAEAAITDATLESIVKGCGTKLKVLDISWCEDITDYGMSIIAKNCPSLQRLGLRQCSASNLTLDTLAANCHLIASLNIAGVESLTDTTLGTLAENMPLLREIDVSWNSSLSDTGISALLACCTKLNKAVLCGLKRITSQPFLAIIGDLGRWGLLQELWMHNRGSMGGIPKGKVALKSCDSETAKSLGDEIPCRSMSYAPSLREVLVEYSDKVNDDHLAAIVAVCRGTLFIKDYYGQPVQPKWIFR